MKAFIYERYGPVGGVDRCRQHLDQDLADVRDRLVDLGHSKPLRWHVLRGKPLFSRATLGLLRPKHQILGVDVAGEVAAVGSGVTGFQVGDQVYANLLDHGYGGFAEYAVVPVAAMASKPAKLSLVEAAAVPMAAVTALQGLDRHGQLQAGQLAQVGSFTRSPQGRVGRRPQSFTLRLTGRHRALPAPPWPGRAGWLVKPGETSHAENLSTEDLARPYA